MSSSDIRIRVVGADLFERLVPFRLPFRFGAATLTRVPQAFVQTHVEVEGRGHRTGLAAELLVPKWFDKSPDKSNEDNTDDLRRALFIAIDAYATETRPLSPFALHAAQAGAIENAGRAAGLNPLVANFGPALIDRAILDAVGRMFGLSAFALIRHNVPDMASTTAPDLASVGLSDALARLQPSAHLHIRHTVGMLAPLTAADGSMEGGPRDGLPTTLEEVIARYGHRYFKLKLSGDVDADITRLTQIAGVLDRLVPDYRCTLDGNEQYTTARQVADLLDRLDHDPALARLRAGLLYIEQPIHRDRTFEEDLSPLTARIPFEIDEADGTMDAFPKARALGYRGVSSKACKGIYRAVLNRLRTDVWNAETPGAPHFVAAEDLTCQAGLALQQDLALSALIGCTHTERNGHHFAHGMAGAPAAEQQAFRQDHADLYTEYEGVTCLSIAGGRVPVGSLHCAGWGSAVRPDLDALEAMGRPRDEDRS